MGKPTGFLEWLRVPMGKRPVAARLRDWKEIYQRNSDEILCHQGGRCMNCGVPFCEQGCPLGNEIPDWNHQVYAHNWREAYRRLAATNNFPEFTGRLCPAPCEGACVLAIDEAPVTIEQLEMEIAERAFANGWVVARAPKVRSGATVAVVGSGPAGLAAADQLNSAGHKVTVYEAADRAGGLLRYGIPDFKIDKNIVDRRLQVMKAAGIEFRTGVRVGESPTWSELRAQHSAVLIAIGAQRPHDLDLPGRHLGGVHQAMSYLEAQNRAIAAGSSTAPEISAAGKRAVVLGGGDTGADCCGTALRQGASHVLQVELFPAPPEHRSPSNPWPQQPRVLRTSASHEEGAERVWAVRTTEIVGDGNRVSSLKAVRVRLETDDTGRRRIVDIPGSEHQVPCDLLILAIGFRGAASEKIAEQLGVELTPAGNIAVDHDYATSVDGVFSAGDSVRGASLIVWAIAEGRMAARTIDRYLRAGAESRLPSCGRDEPFEQL